MITADSLIVIGMAVASLGTILEADGPRAHTFRVQNQSADTLTLVQGYTSCGCTTIRYGHGADVAPGECTEVELRFNPRGKGGSFYERADLVYRRKSDSKGERRSVQMALTGECITSEETLVRQFPVVVNDSLRLSTVRFDLGRMTVGDTRERSIVVLHGSDNRRERIPLRFTVTGDMPRGLQHIEHLTRVSDTTVVITFDVLIY